MSMCLGVLGCGQEARGQVVREMETANSLPQGFLDREWGGGSWGPGKDC